MKKIVRLLLIILCVCPVFSQTNSISKELINDAKSGNAHSQALLAQQYLKSPSSFNDGFQWAQKSAEHGDALAQYLSGVCYYNGYGVAQSYTEAVKWYRLAADQGYRQAQYNLEICYKMGLGVEKSYDEAAKWFQLAAEKNYPQAQYELGIYFASSYIYGNKEDREKSIIWLKKAAESQSSVSNSAKKALQMLEVPGY